MARSSLLIAGSGFRFASLASLLLSLSLLFLCANAGEAPPSLRSGSQARSRLQGQNQAAAAAGGESTQSAAVRPPPEALEPQRVFHYTMSGGVRLLVFWASRQDVGGGWIILSGEPGGGRPAWQEEIRVLFGSKPERVPGGVNRWGYGRERSTWVREGAEAKPVPSNSVFEGFIRHSSEETAEEAVANARNEGHHQAYWYDAMQSTVHQDRALSEVRVFSAASDFDYRNPDPIFESYRSRLKSGPPDRTRTMDRGPGAQGGSCGFLTAVRLLVDGLISDPPFQDQLTDGDPAPALTYYYGARPYRLWIRKLSDPTAFDAPAVRGGLQETGQAVRFQRVAKVSLRALNVQQDSNTDFDLWIPLDGPLRGIPLRIEHKPRWWLRVRLDLILDPSGNPARDLSTAVENGP